MILLIDNYDSFTYNLIDYFYQLGEPIQVVKNDEYTAEQLAAFTFKAIVISPGPNRPKDSGHLMAIIDCYHNKLPILGICLGHQALGEYFGATLTHAKQPMHGKASSIQHQQTGLYQSIPQGIKVCRYHSLILEQFEQTPLTVTAVSEQGECMGFEHQTLPIHGMQYHPEAILTEHGLDLLKNWCKTLR